MQNQSLDEADEIIAFVCGDNEELISLLRKCREQGEELFIAVMNIIQQPKLEEMQEMMSRLSKELAIHMFEPETISLLDWQREWQRNNNNFRKAQNLTLARRRCRWRQRESRRQTESLITCLDPDEDPICA